jgi:xylogalacturonan beta-1,3-xylosyltransferase
VKWDFCFDCLLTESLIKQVQKELHKKSRIETMEEGLARARTAIRKATRMRNYTSYKKESFVPRGSIYINPYAFHQLSSSIAMIYNLDSFFV